MLKVTEGEGLLGCGWVLVVDQAKIDAVQSRRGSGLKEIGERGEMNVIAMEQIKKARGQGLPKEVGTSSSPSVTPSLSFSHHIVILQSY